MIEFKNVNVMFKQNSVNVHAVKNVSFTIKQGEIFGIVGASGAGKSTLLRTINLLQPITDGQVIVDNKAIEHYKGESLRSLRQNIGMVFQHFNLANSKTVYENVAFALQASNWKKNDINTRVMELLDFVNLLDKANEYPAKLSGGQKQRVAIARALANNTKILLCYEATSALDAETTASVLRLLKEINEKLGITMVVITHELDVVKEICSRVAVMNNGEVVELGDVYDVFTNTKNDFTKQLISHTQLFELPLELISNISGPVLRLTYQGANATKSILSHISNSFDVGFNILHGKIEYIGGKPLGILYVNLTGKSDNIKNAILYLNQEVSRVEVVYNAK
ncbi:MAG TPA: ATP-binding cassette domain-containing protein [Clostridiales bacterium]|nr:ATP-binding cassette domain-containing protein [Clostridiales bacterium]